MGPKRVKKSFSKIRRERILEAFAIYVLRDSGHITDLSNQFVKTTRKSNFTRQLFGNLILVLFQLRYYVLCKQTRRYWFHSGPGVHYLDFSWPWCTLSWLFLTFLGKCCTSWRQGSQILTFPDRTNPERCYNRLSLVWHSKKYQSWPVINIW